MSLTKMEWWCIKYYITSVPDCPCFDVVRGYEEKTVIETLKRKLRKNTYIGNVRFHINDFLKVEHIESFATKEEAQQKGWELWKNK